MKLTLTPELSPEAAREAYRFQISATSGTYQQWPYWTGLNPPTARQTYLHFRISDASDDLVASGIIRLTRIFFGLQFAAIQRGPATNAVEDLRDVLPEIERALRGYGAINLTVNPYWLGDAAEDCVALLTSLGYRPVPRELQNMPTTTAVVDLSRDEEEIFAGFDRSTRKAVRRAEQLGVKIMPVTTIEQAREISEIMVSMAAHRGMTIDNQYDLVNHFLFLQDHPMAGVMLRSEYEGQTLGGILAYREGARAGPHMMASDHTARSNIPRNQGIMWELMRGMRDLGCTEFDMIGYPDDRYDTPEDAKRRGAFKAGFNPLTQRVPPLMVKPLRPVANAIALRLRAIVREARKPRVHKFGPT